MRHTSKPNYYLKYKKCRKPNCRVCQQGPGHGPYWHMSLTDPETRRTVETYIGKHLPPQTQLPHAIGRTNQSPLVGRERELQTLQECLILLDTRTKRKTRKRSELASSGAQMVVLLGEVGLGKTRLAEETAREAQRRNWTVAWGRAYARESAAPYRLWIEVLRHLLAQCPHLYEEMTQDSLLYQPLCRLIPEIQRLFPVELHEPPLVREQEQLCIWDAICGLCRRACSQTPLLLVLDDLQWAEDSSYELLPYLMRQLRTAPVLVLCTCRTHAASVPVEVQRIMADLTREQMMETISLTPLRTEHMHQLLAHIPASLVDRVAERASGNPFFAEELARSLNTFAPSADVPREHSEKVRLPETIQAVLDLRLANVSEPCRRLLEHAAVLVDAFSLETITAMTAAGSVADDGQTLDLLEEAERAGILVETEQGAQVAFTFWHPLLSAALYEQLSGARRASLHRRAAHVFQEQYAGRAAEGAADITYHLVRGGASDPLIVQSAEMAADQAFRLAAYPLAARHYRLALAHLEHMPLEAQQQQYLSLLERLGECLMILGEYVEARQCYLRLLDEIPTRDGENRTRLQALLWSEVGWSWRYTGEMDRARECCKRGEQILREAGVTAGTVWASLSYQRGSICWLEGKYEEARISAEHALALYEEAVAHAPAAQRESVLPMTRLQRTLAGDPVDVGRIHTLLASLAATVGQSTEAIQHYTAALALFEQHERQREIASVLCNLGDVYLRQAEHALAEHTLRRAWTVTERMGNRATLCVIEGNLGVLAHRYGKLAEAETQYRKALALAEHLQDPIYISLWHSYLATALHEQGQVQQAGAAIRQALAAGRTIPPCFAFAFVVLGGFRINQALVQWNNKRSVDTRFAAGTEALLKRALACEGIEAETQGEGELLLAQLALLRRDPALARLLVHRVREQAKQHAHQALQARTEEMQAAVFLQEGETTRATRCFEQALHLFHATGMRLAWARACMRYGAWLVQEAGGQDARCQQGYHLLQEAARVFQECQAVLDAQAATSLLKQFAEGTKKL